MAEVTIKGAKELARKLERVDAAMERRILVNILGPAAKMLRDEVRRGARNHALSRSIGVTTSNVRGRIQHVKVGPAKKVRHLARWQEGGTNPHPIPKRRLHKRVMARDGIIYGTRVRHPGSRARPFVEPVYQHRQRRAVEMVAEALGREIAIVMR